MKSAGALILWLAMEGLLLWFAIKLSFEAWRVMNGHVTDRRGKPLWFYAKVDGLPLGAKNRNQALILTIGSAALGFLLGLLPIVKLVEALTR